MLKNKLRLVIGVILLSAVAALLVIAGGKMLRTEISVAPVERGQAVNAVPGVVRVAAERRVEVRTESEGRVLEGRMEVGGHVSEGDVLLRLDDAELVRAIERAHVELEAEEEMREVGSPLRYELDEAREELTRRKELHAEGEFSRREIEVQTRLINRLQDEISLEKIRQKRRIQLLKNEIEGLEKDLEKTEIRAPVNGTVVETYAHVGDVLGPRARVVQLLSDERVIEATLSEENFAGVEPGQSAKIRFLSYGSRVFSGEVAKVLPSANPETQRYTIHLNVDMPEELKVPGLTGEVSVILGERDGALIAPRRALLGGDVFVLRDGRVDLQEVEAGFISLNHVEVVDGLEEGDRVAVENLDRLRDGDRVRLKK